MHSVSSLETTANIDRLEAARLEKELANTHRFEHKASALKTSILPLDHERLNCATSLLTRIGLALKSSFKVLLSLFLWQAFP